MRVCMQSIVTLLFSCCVLVTVGCQSGEHGAVAVVGSPRGVGPLIDPVDASDLGYDLQWSTDLGVPDGQSLSRIEVLGDVIVCIESPSNMVTAVSMRDGSMIWRRIVGKVADELYHPVRSGDRLLINSEQLLYSIDIGNGRMIEASRLQSLVNHAPAIVGEVAIFGGLNHRVFAHAIRAGYTKWAYQLTDRVFARPATFGPNVFVADGNGVYAMFVAQTGDLLWKGRTFSRVSARPAMSHLGVLVAGEDHSLYALHGATGRDRWVYHSTQPLTLSPHVFGDTVILPMSGQGLVALDARTGLEEWRLPFMAQPIYQFENTVLMYTADSLIALETGSGNILIEVPVRRIKKVMHADDRKLVLVSPEGRLLLLVPQT